jgi:hypothetical protein
LPSRQRVTTWFHDWAEDHHDIEIRDNEGGRLGKARLPEGVEGVARKNYAGTSPITRASGKSRVVLARYARNRRLADACYLWAFAALTTRPGSPSLL